MGITSYIFVKESFSLDLPKSEFFNILVFYATFRTIVRTKYMQERRVLWLNR